MYPPFLSHLWHVLTRCRSLLSSVFHLTQWGCLLLLAIVLSGCVKSDVGVQFLSPGRGEIFQHIQIEAPPELLTANRWQEWIQQLERRATDAGGTVQQHSAQALDITIPFANPGELQQKFNQFFDAVYNQEFSLKGNTLPAIAAHLTVNHSNFLLMERQHLTWAIDIPALVLPSLEEKLADDGTVELPLAQLSSIEDSSADDSATNSVDDLSVDNLSAEELAPESSSTENNAADHVINPILPPQLQFQLNTPWSVRSVTRSGQVRPQSLQNGKTLVWTLTPGEQNTLEAVFWMPNAIGIGTLLIVGFVALGHVLKYYQAGNKMVGYE